MARNPLLPIYVVSKKEFKTNLLSVRMAILLAIFALVVVGASYGFSGLSTGPSSEEQLALWVHPMVREGQLGIVVFASDAWGVPHEGMKIELYEENLTTNTQILVDEATTDSDGFARFMNLPEGFYSIEASLGVIGWGTGMRLDRDYPAGNLSFETRLFDLDNSGLSDNLAVHFMDINGEVPQAVTVYLEDQTVDPPDSRGFLSLKLREGTNNLTFVYGEETYQELIFARQSPIQFNPFAQGPDFVLFFIAMTFGTLLLPIVAIALSYDSIAKEKLQGSGELLLYRPASWRAVAAGKFLGVFAALALPVTGVNLVGVFVITAVTGTWPDATFTLGFVAFSLFLLAVYTLFVQTLSTLAKTAGTAILFAIVLWFTFNVLWSIVIFLVSIALRLPLGSREYFVLASYLGLFNPSGIYQSLFTLVLPEGLEMFGAPGAVFALPVWVPPVAAVLWLAVLLILFLELFKRKAAG
ncbi:MAG: ABC transporter permease subunit [Thermoplasmata archaeon]